MSNSGLALGDAPEMGRLLTIVVAVRSVLSDAPAVAIGSTVLIAVPSELALDGEGDDG